MTTQNHCTHHNGVFQGTNTTCATANCSRGEGAAPRSAADWNHDGRIDMLDLNAFLSAYSRAQADINGDGFTDQRDVMLFTSTFVAEQGVRR
jgi:hypothetical protein